MRELAPFGYPGYYADETGRIYNERRTKHGNMRLVEVKQSMSVRGSLKVNIRNRDGIFTSTTVARLVALAYVPIENDLDTDVVHRNFDLTDDRPENLIWRPYWIVQGYQRQSVVPLFRQPIPVECVETGEVFETLLDAAQHYGCLAGEIYESCENRYGIKPYPTYSQWRYVE